MGHTTCSLVLPFPCLAHTSTLIHHHARSTHAYPLGFSRPPAFYLGDAMITARPVPRPLNVERILFDKLQRVVRREIHHHVSKVVSLYRFNECRAPSKAIRVLFHSWRSGLLSNPERADRDVSALLGIAVGAWIVARTKLVTSTPIDSGAACLLFPLSHARQARSANS